MSKKNLLIITESMPYPLNSGGNIAQFEMNDSIKENYNLIMIFQVYQKDIREFDKLKEIWPDVQFFPIFNTRISKFKNLASTLLFKKSIEIYNKIVKKNKFKSQDFTETEKFIINQTKIFESSAFDVDQRYVVKLYDVLNNIPIDIIQVEFHNVLPIVTYLPKSVPKIYVNHEIRYVREIRELSLIKNQLPYLKMLYLRNKGFELNLMNEYDKIATVSVDDSVELSKYLPVEKIYASPLTIRFDYKSTNFIKKEVTKTVIFLGGENHFPNKDGLNWFITNCWSQLQDKGIKLKIIGNWNKDTIAKIENHYKGIEFVGFVEDLAQAMHEGVFIVPIRIGSGVRMKILDAVMNYLPFITTSVGVEGLNFKKNEDYVLADSSQEFVDAILQLTQDINLMETLSANARKRLIEEYSYDKLISLRLKIYSNLTN